MLLLIPKRIQGNRQGEKGTATDQHRKQEYPDQKESPAEHIIRCDKRRLKWYAGEGSKTHQKQFIHCANDCSATRSLTPLLIAYKSHGKESLLLWQGIKASSALYLLQDMKPHMEEGLLHKAHCFCRFPFQCFVSNIQALKVQRRST